MAYLDPSWLSEDEHAEYINSVENITAYTNSVDREIETIALSKGVRVDEIPVDGSGYLTSRVLQSYAIAFTFYRLFAGYWGKRQGEEDIYYDKMTFWREEMTRIKGMITEQSILGLEDSNGDPAGCGYATYDQVAV